MHLTQRLLDYRPYHVESGGDALRIPSCFALQVTRTYKAKVHADHGNAVRRTNIKASMLILCSSAPGVSNAGPAL